jgi:hypothetical protein
MVATAAKDMPRTVEEVQASKRMIQQQGKHDEDAAGAASLHCIKPWPVLPASLAAPKGLSDIPACG